ncbi:Phosphomannomutase OS=Streptomyces fumanus OX=67302 GN=GCM10018772_42270 PE=3 SV=1 [Streptomyces fumanus]
MDLAFATAREAGPDLVIANDPDADRLAVAVRDGADWRMLRGDEVGALLAAHLVRRGARGTFAESIVSSSLLGRIAERAGLRHTETLTGFKWIARAEGLRYGYEEALGYCVDPDGVRDKDGITAALLVTELASELKEEGRTLLDLLDDLAVEHGLHATDQLAVRVADLSLITDAMRGLRERPPGALAGLPVTRAEDLTHGAGAAAHGRAALHARRRPGRRPPQRHGALKLKCYLEVVVPVASRAGLPAARATATDRLTRIKQDLSAALGL